MTECVLNLDLFAIMSGLMLPSHPPDQPDLCAEGAGARSALWRAPFSKVEGLTANMSFACLSKCQSSWNYHSPSIPRDVPKRKLLWSSLCGVQQHTKPPPLPRTHLPRSLTLTNVSFNLDCFSPLDFLNGRYTETFSAAKIHFIALLTGFWLPYL